MWNMDHGGTERLSYVPKILIKMNNFCQNNSNVHIRIFYYYYANTVYPTTQVYLCGCVLYYGYTIMMYKT